MVESAETVLLFFAPVLNQFAVNFFLPLPLLQSDLQFYNLFLCPFLIDFERDKSFADFVHSRRDALDGFINDINVEDHL